METKLVQNFASHVNEVITSDQDKDALFEALKRYQSSADIKRLVNDLKRLINEPTKLEIYDAIRPLIRPTHQQQYDKLAPKAPGRRLRVIKLRRRGQESFGFAVRGGFEHGVGIFVSHIEPGLQADQKGLKMGDEIVRVNGFTIAEAIHEEVLNLIKGRDEIELKVTNIGMVPIKQNRTDPVTWQYVDKPGLAKAQDSVADMEKGNLVKIFINLHGASGLGCSIISGPQHFPGIFIESVRPGSLGEDYNLEVGDQIIEVNGKSFEKIKHKEAIVELKGSKELNMVIKKAVGLPLLNMKKKGEEGSPVPVRKASSPVPEDNSEILEEDLYSKVEKRNWEEEQEMLKKQRAEEEIREQNRLQRQLEEEQRAREEEQRAREEEEQRAREEEQRAREEEQRAREEEEKRQAEEHQRRLAEAERIRQEEEKEQQRRQLEELRIQQEERIRAEERKKEERVKEEKKKKEEAKKRKEKEEERKKKEIIEKKQQSAVLAGRSGPSNSMKPTLLGAAPGTQSSFGSSGNVKEVLVTMEENIGVDIELEGGVGSPLGGKIVIADVYPGGAVDRSGEIRKGDQILKVNGANLEEVSLSEANEILWKAEQECLPGDSLKFVVMESGLSHEDEVTFF